MAIHYAQDTSSGSLPPDAEPGTIIGLLRRLTDEVSTLFRQELALAIAELSRSLTKLLAGTVSIAVGGAVLFAGLLVLLAAAVLALAIVLPPWLAALIVGVVVGVAGFGMVQAGRKTLAPAAIKLTQSQESLKRDKNVLTGSER